MLKGIADKFLNTKSQLYTLGGMNVVYIPPTNFLPFKNSPTQIIYLLWNRHVQSILSTVLCWNSSFSLRKFFKLLYIIV